MIHSVSESTLLETDPNLFHRAQLLHPRKWRRFSLTCPVRRVLLYLHNYFADYNMHCCRAVPETAVEEEESEEEEDDDDDIEMPSGPPPDSDDSDDDDDDDIAMPTGPPPIRYDNIPTGMLS